MIEQEQKHQLMNYSEPVSKELIEVLSRLVSCKSITPFSAGSLRYIEEYFAEFNPKTEYFNFGEGEEYTENMLLTLGESEPHFLFAGHVDVVPPGNLELWSTDPFKLSLHNEQLVGRGVVDMKGAIACFMLAAKQILKEGLNYKISFLLTSDEEASGKNGIKRAIQHIKDKKFDLCLVGEPTSRHKLADVIKHGRRGSLSFKLKIIGCQGHVAYPNLAKNPIADAMHIIQELQLHKFDDADKNFDASNLEITSIDVDNEVTNIIPAEINIRGNIRYNIHQTEAGLQQLIEQKLHQKNINYEIEFLPGSVPFLSGNEKYEQLISESIEQVLGYKPEINTEGGTSDARYLHKIVPSLELGLKNNLAHKIDEAVLAKDLEQLQLIYYYILQRFSI